MSAAIKLPITGRFIQFELFSIEPITELQALTQQTGYGYNPMGYGFYSFKCIRVDDYFKATWSCASSCE